MKKFLQIKNGIPKQQSTFRKTIPSMHVERFNRTIQENFVDYHTYELMDLKIFNRKVRNVVRIFIA